MRQHWINNFLILFFCFFFYSCPSKTVREKIRIDYGLNQKSEVLKVHHLAFEELRYVSQTKNEDTIQKTVNILSIVSFSNNVSKILKTLDQYELSQYKYFTGEGIGLLISVYLQNGYSLQDIKWDFYKLNQVLKQKQIKLFSNKGIKILKRIILNKFGNILRKKEIKSTFLIMPNCNGGKFELSLASRLGDYFNYFLKNSKITCIDHVKQISKYMTKKIDSSLIYFSQIKYSNDRIDRYLANINLGNFKKMKELHD